MRKGDHHIFRGDQIQVGQIFLAGTDFGTAVIAEIVLDLEKFTADDIEQALRNFEDFDQIADFCE